MPFPKHKTVWQYDLQARGPLGTAGWGADGLIGDLPVLLYDATTQEKVVHHLSVSPRMFTDSGKTKVKFTTYSTGLPVATTGDGVRWQLEANYIGVGELATKTPDETLVQTEILPSIVANTKQNGLEFDLDGSLMNLADCVLLTLSRLPGHADDNYASDIAVIGVSLHIDSDLHKN